ncbi:hypothetical protein D3C75_921860 [compost metagenome]
MSIFRDNSFLTRLSPSSVFRIKWMVIDDIKSAILSTAIFTSGLSDSFVYPDTNMDGSPPLIKTPIGVCGSDLVLLTVLFFLLPTYITLLSLSTIVLHYWIFLYLQAFAPLQILKHQRYQSAAQALFFQIGSCHPFFQ